MFRFQVISIAFFIVFFSLVIQYQQSGLSIYYSLVALIVYVLILVAGAACISLNFYLTSLNKGKTDKKEIALTFDDGPHPIVTLQLLKILDRHKVKATFFVKGKNIASTAEIMKRISTDGHIVGNHSFTHHKWFDLFSTSKMVEEILKTNEMIENITGQKPVLFRPPFGVTNPNLGNALDRTGMISTGWSLRTFDTCKSAEDVLKKLKNKTKPGCVVLLHDTDEKVLKITEEYINWLNENGYIIVGLDQLFSINAYEKV